MVAGPTEGRGHPHRPGGQGKGRTERMRSQSGLLVCLGRTPIQVQGTWRSACGRLCLTCRKLCLALSGGGKVAEGNIPCLI